MHAEGPGLAKHVGVCPGQLECLSHDEPAEYLVESVSVLWLADYQILQFGILSRVIEPIYQSLYVLCTSIHTEFSGLILALKDIAL